MGGGLDECKGRCEGGDFEEGSAMEGMTFLVDAKEYGLVPILIRSCPTNAVLGSYPPISSASQECR